MITMKDKWGWIVAGLIAAGIALGDGITPIIEGLLRSNLNSGGYSITNAANIVLSSGASLSNLNAQVTGTSPITTATVQGFPDRSMLVAFENTAVDGIYQKHAAADWRRRTVSTPDGSYMVANKNDQIAYADGTAGDGRWKVYEVINGSEATAIDIRAVDPNDSATHPGAVAAWEYWDYGLEEWVASGGSGYSSVVYNVVVKTTEGRVSPVTGVYAPAAITNLGDYPVWYKVGDPSWYISYNAGGEQWELAHVTGGYYFLLGMSGNPVSTPDSLPETWVNFVPGEEDWNVTVTALPAAGMSLSNVVRDFYERGVFRVSGTAGTIPTLDADGRLSSNTNMLAHVVMKGWTSLGARGYGSSVPGVQDGFPYQSFVATGEYNSYYIPQGISSLRLYCYTPAHADANKGGSWYAYLRQFQSTSQASVSTNIGTLTKSIAGAQYQLVTIPITNGSSTVNGPYSLYLVWRTNTTSAASITNVWLLQATHLP